MGSEMCIRDRLGEYVRGKGFTQHFTVAGMLNGVVLFLTTALFVPVLGWGIEGAYAAMILGPAASLSYLAWLCCRIYGEGPELEDAEKRELMGFSIPLVGSAVAWYLILVTDRMIISGFLDLTATGKYALASKMSSILLVVFPIFNMSLTESAILNFRATNRNEFFDITYNFALRAATALAVLIIGGFLMVSPWMVPTEYSLSVKLVPLLVLSALLNNLVTLFDPIHVAANSTRTMLTGSIAIFVINALLHLLLIRSLGIFASAASSIAAMGLVAVWRYNKAREFVPIRFTLRTLLSCAVALFAVIVSYYSAFRNHELVCLVLSVGAAAYLSSPVIIHRLGPRKTD